MSETVRLLAQMPNLHDLPIGAIHLVMGLRLTAITRRSGDDPMEFLAIRFGSITTAKAFLNVAGSMGKAWPEPFMLSRPCCGCITHDEALAAKLLVAVQSRDQTQFSELCRDLLSEAHHAQIFSAMARFAGALATTTRTSV